MKAAPPVVTRPGWSSVAIVCKDCGKRRKGPKGFKSKEAVAALKHALRRVRPRPRVVSSGCLGICPKRALALAWAGGTGPTRVVHIESLEQLTEVAAWAGPPAAD